VFGFVGVHISPRAIFSPLYAQAMQFDVMPQQQELLQFSIWRHEMVVKAVHYHFHKNL